jgi:hypothetical protein
VIVDLLAKLFDALLRFHGAPGQAGLDIEAGGPPAMLSRTCINC